MKRRNAFAIAGGFIGFFLGSSIGIAAGGTAVNGAWVLSAILAFIGWLIGNNQNTTSSIETSCNSAASGRPIDTVNGTENSDNVTAVLRGTCELLASIWNFHIDLLRHLGLLKAFCERPWLFVTFAFAVSFFLPPFAAAYGTCYLCASFMGAEKNNQFRAQI